MDYDVVVIGAGPAGLAAAIRLKQISPDLSVVVVEKGSEPGAHILSGVVIDPVGLDKLLPNWREDPARPLKTQVRQDNFLILTASSGFRLPNFIMPKLMNNHGNFIGSLGDVVRFLGRQAEGLGVEIYPGFAATALLHGETGEVLGVATGDMGVARDGHLKENFTRGMELRGKFTLFAEGAHGSLAKQLIAKFGLAAGCEPQKYGIGLKELWRIDKSKHQAGLVQHSFGWPLMAETGGGSFLYHFDDDLVSIGFVVHLNYSNPTLSPFDEFQRFKTHPLIAPTLAGGKRLAYGARALTEGGWQSVPKLVFPGGALIGCAAGFMNVPRIKGSHNAILSGVLAAEQLAKALQEGRTHDELAGYEEAWRASAIGRDLRPVRNVKPLWSKFGTYIGAPLGGLDMWTNELFGFSFFGTLQHGKPDHATLKLLKDVQPIVYPKPDGKLSFDKLSSVFVSNTNHEEDQPSHLRLADPDLPVRENLPLYPQAMLEHLAAAGLAKHDMPEFILPLTEMPLTASGKIVKRELVRWVAEGRVRPVPVRFRSTNEVIE
ncbi:MAG: 4Fe-4S dicluster domain-containing protein [Methylocystis sp.]|nr:4Fe-4S dicluster domain-containing protein [Methylocystis sp.]